MDPQVARHVGAGLLGEIEEESLEELLNTFRTTTLPQSQGHPALQPPIPIPTLSSVISKHHHANQSAPPPLLSLQGRHLAFIYHLVSTLIADPHRYSVVIVDVEHRFDVTRLVSPLPPNVKQRATVDPAHPATVDDLKHIYIYRPPRSALPRSKTASDTSNTGPDPPNHTQLAIQAAREHMIYGPHASRDRVWWGAVVIGGGGGDVNATWKGWMEVQRREVPGFGVGLSLEEALVQRGRRNEIKAESGWEGRSRVGGYVWGMGRAGGS